MTNLEAKQHYHRIDKDITNSKKPKIEKSHQIAIGKELKMIMMMPREIQRNLCHQKEDNKNCVQRKTKR